jgi:hypothetical protein
MFLRALVFIVAFTSATHLVGMRAIGDHIINQLEQTWIIDKSVLVSPKKLSPQELQSFINLLNGGTVGASFLAGLFHSFHKSMVASLVGLSAYAFVVNNEYKESFIALHGLNKVVDGKLVADISHVELKNPFQRVNPNQLMMIGSVIGAYAAGFAVQYYLKKSKEALLDTKETLIA